jgi:hypothetical protein
VHGQQIRLLNDADLKFNRDDEQNESRQRHQIRCHQRDSETERHHRGEDRVAHPIEYTGAHQRRRLGGIDSDAPRITHIELRVDRRCDADHRDHDAGGLDPGRVQNAHRRHRPEQLQHRGNDSGRQRDDKADTGEPFRRTEPSADAAEARRSGAAALFPTAPTESERTKDGE